MSRLRDPGGLARFAARLGDEWKILILRDLADGPRRFSELERNVPGICPRTLSQRLRSLQEDRLVVRRARSEAGRVEYELSERGKCLIPLLEMMRDYGERWL